MIAAARIGWHGDLDFSKECGMELVQEAVRGWVPRLVDIRSGSREEDEAGADFLVETPSSVIRVDAKFRRKDYRPFADDVALELWSDKARGKVGWTLDWSKQTDLVVWMWMDTKRTLVLPFRPLRETTVANGREWCHNYRTEIQNSNDGLTSYWQSECVFLPLSVLKSALSIPLLHRFGIDLSLCEPAGMRFCRQPNCPQTAMWPCKPERSVWCYRHWMESKGEEVMEHQTDGSHRQRARGA